jgi:hypothetical protein
MVTVVSKWWFLLACIVVACDGPVVALGQQSVMEQVATAGISATSTSLLAVEQESSMPSSESQQLGDISLLFTPTTTTASTATRPTWMAPTPTPTSTAWNTADWTVVSTMTMHPLATQLATQDLWPINKDKLLNNNKNHSRSHSTIIQPALLVTTTALYRPESSMATWANFPDLLELLPFNLRPIGVLPWPMTDPLEDLNEEIELSIEP